MKLASYIVNGTADFDVVVDDGIVGMRKRLGAPYPTLRHKTNSAVVPANAGTHTPCPLDRPVVMGPRLRGDDSGVSGDG